MTIYAKIITLAAVLVALAACAQTQTPEIGALLFGLVGGALVGHPLATVTRASTYFEPVFAAAAAACSSTRAPASRFVMP